VLAIDFAAIAALVPLGTVLGFAALLLKRWWTQQDNAMAAAIEASNKEGAKCEERIAQLRTHHDQEMAELRRDFERVQAAVRQVLPLVPTEVQSQLWDLMWSTRSPNNEPTNSAS
jgi:hypothetical protein